LTANRANIFITFNNMNRPTPPQARAQAFLSVAHQFHLGTLITEKPHPLTRRLSGLAKDNLPVALKVLHAVDQHALDLFAQRLDRIVVMAGEIQKTLAAGHRIFLCGCGATGRLSLVCEMLWRLEHRGTPLEGRVIGFMAGGDAALIRSIENFEDHPEYGRRQLLELGFGPGDLLVACTEGGETPFVIGAALAAAETSGPPPFFLYCNPDDVLRRATERSAKVIADPRIEKINLPVGPMAVMGSTRMQAGTVLMAAVGAALLWHSRPDQIHAFANQFQTAWARCDTAFLEPFILRESEAYHQGRHLLYQTGGDLAISVLTDTTERSPTFSMIPFENCGVPSDPHSLCYLYLPLAKDSLSAWSELLLRPPRALQWDEIGKITSLERLLGFDFSAKLTGRRLSGPSAAAHDLFSIQEKGPALCLKLGDHQHLLDIRGLPRLGVHLILKMLLNTHSTLALGRMGRFEGNVMTFVRPTNNKLVDRAIRYAQVLLRRKGGEASYEQLAYACFDCLERLPVSESIVHAMVERFPPRLDAIIDTA
jgi:N-acetylmuramic acid 6-phosphate etherase